MEEAHLTQKGPLSTRLVVVNENKSEQQAWEAKLLQWSDSVMKSLGYRCHPMASGGSVPLYFQSCGAAWPQVGVKAVALFD